VAQHLRLTLEYDGEAFSGWQRQPGGVRTVQGELEAALARVTRERVGVVAAGRTDAGVHAEGQVVSLALETPRDPAGLARALNGVLPVDVAVRALREAPVGFDARRDALSKWYRYAIWNGPLRSPLRRRRALCLQRPLALPAMRQAAEACLGRHDFASFQAADSGVRHTARSLARLDLEGEAGGALAIQVEGDGFLRHMVRILVGTLIEVGSGRRPPEAMHAILAARARGAAGPTAPAHGLTLVAVRYPAEAQTDGLFADRSSSLA